MEFVDFVRLLATFKPTNKKNEEHLKQSKLKCKYISLKSNILYKYIRKTQNIDYFINGKIRLFF